MNRSKEIYVQVSALTCPTTPWLAKTGNCGSGGDPLLHSPAWLWEAWRGGELIFSFGWWDLTGIVFLYKCSAAGFRCFPPRLPLFCHFFLFNLNSTLSYLGSDPLKHRESVSDQLKMARLCFPKLFRRKVLIWHQSFIQTYIHNLYRKHRMWLQMVAQRKVFIWKEKLSWTSKGLWV